MAAQERTKQAQTKTEPPQQQPADLLMTFDPPSTGGTAPPPVFDSSMLPPPQPSSAPEAPPPFEAVQEQMNFPPPPPIDAVAPPPAIDSLPPPAFDSVAAPGPTAPVFAPSAPAFEDLLDPHPAPPPLAGMQAVPPPAPEPAAPQIDEDVLAALDPAEREALLEEQRQIMAQIEKDKTGNMASGAAARALAFDQRSNTAVARAAGMMDRPGSAATRPPARREAAAPAASSASGGRTVDLGAGQTVPLHGQDKTEQAIKDGTAALVQCVNCQNWMQVTDNATLMFCPVCQVVSPVEKADGATTAASMEQAAQMDADQKLAEQLQREEYKQAGGGGSSATRRPKPKKKETAEEGQSWYDWIVGNPEAKPSTPASSQQRSPGLVSARTGEERGYSGSSGGVGGGARVAESKSMFACVADSVATAATAMTATTLTQDGEGNVHGVDSSSLLAMPQVSRQQN